MTATTLRSSSTTGSRTISLSRATLIIAVAVSLGAFEVGLVRGADVNVVDVDLVGTPQPARHVHVGQRQLPAPAERQSRHRRPTPSHPAEPGAATAVGVDDVVFPGGGDRDGRQRRRVVRKIESPAGQHDGGTDPQNGGGEGSRRQSLTRQEDGGAAESPEGHSGRGRPSLEEGDSSSPGVSVSFWSNSYSDPTSPQIKPNPLVNRTQIKEEAEISEDPLLKIQRDLESLHGGDVEDVDAVEKSLTNNEIEDGDPNDVNDGNANKKKERRIFGLLGLSNPLDSIWRKWISAKRFGQTSANFAGSLASDKLQSAANKQDRLLSLFTFVKFNNSECVSASGDSGSCFTPKECHARGGRESGTCASGFGVCCVFFKTCDGIAMQNGTYFVNDGYPEGRTNPGRCQLTAVKPNNRICQLRVDFVNFELAGPSSDVNNNQTYGQCNTDQFVVTHQTGSITPVICGTNSGQHMYLDFRQADRLQLIFLTGPSLTFTMRRRNWKLKLTQIPCGADNEVAPTGCLQYFRNVSGRIQSFNYNEARGQQLANQDYTICFSMENGFCGIQYQQCPDLNNAESESFTVSNVNGPFTAARDGNCTINNPAGMVDWVSIPCATDVANSIENSDGSSCTYQLCGSYLSSTLLNQQGAATSQPVYSFQKPLTIYYHTDESDLPPAIANETLRGFCLDYVQQPCPLAVG